MPVILVTATILSVTVLFSFKAPVAGTIRGTVSPPDAAVRAWAISATDTMRTNLSGGLFELSGAKASVYRVIVEAEPPYKNGGKDNVVVTDGQTVDIGVIKLDK
ncbi:hypothetical protein F5148DRAFT_1152619 [Russula earlei]|uniref:Uncharacterized protein n=1 Tax=Russula earlei TaxID=71964 RepID=A0ACC0TWM6_9AGAM|nr:hypothetical protein F5148DRAFT_1152619 [Russula earlei]